MAAVESAFLSEEQMILNRKERGKGKEDGYKKKGRGGRDRLTTWDTERVWVYGFM